MNLLLLLAAFGVGSAAAQDATSPGETKRFEERCAAEGARLWGRSLCAPVVIVDPATGKYRTSATPPAVPLPAMRANTSIRWGDQDWIMVLAPLPSDPARLDALLFHEAWHVHQKALGYAPNSSVAAHLDQPVQRYLLRLEWKALEKALASNGRVQRAHVAQALAFRKRRVGGRSEAISQEREQMRHEGLAAYTGAALSGTPLRLALQELRDGPRRAALGRTFAYVNGPAWGLLLDRYRPGWRRSQEAIDLPDLMPVAAASLVRADEYEGTRILGEEMAAATDRARRIATAMAATTGSKVLQLPLAQMSMDFDPNRVSSGPDGSQLYEKIRLADRWGQIRVDGTPLRISPDFTAAFLPWPVADGVLALGDGWKVEATAEGGAKLVPPS